MPNSEYYPYRSQAVRDSCLAYYDSLAAREWPIASEDRTVATSYGPTFVRVGGPAGAPPLILLPGAAATSLMWRPNIKALSTEHRTYAVDQMGEVGRSVCVKKIRAHEDLFAWLNELLDGLGLTREVNMAGMSYGGALTAQYALRFPERLHKIVLLAPGGIVLRIRIQFWVRMILAAIAPKWCLPPAFRWIFRDMAQKDPDWIDRILEELFMVMRSLQPRKVPIPPVWTDEEWASLRVPALFLVGEHECIYSAERAVRRLKRVAPGVTAEIIPQAGHDLTFAQADLVNRKILDFLRQDTAQPTGAARSTLEA